MSKSSLKIIKTVGSEKNLLIKDCPVLIPKENLKIFSKFSKAVIKSQKEKIEKYNNCY